MWDCGKVRGSVRVGVGICEGVQKSVEGRGGVVSLGECGGGGEGRCGERCGEVQGKVRGVGRIAGVWRSVGKCVACGGRCGRVYGVSVECAGKCVGVWR